MKKLISLILTLMLLALPLTGAAAETMIANPWTDVTARDLMETLGLSLRIPVGAHTVRFRMLKEQSLAELQFDIRGVHYIARIQPTAGFEDISGMYCEWQSDEAVSIGWCEGRLMRAVNEENVIDLMLWYDAAPGLMYSLTAQSPDGANLPPVAEAVYRPAQGEADA